MALTRNFKETVIQRVQSDSTFAQALLDEAATLFLNGEPETARLILRDLVNATIGFEQLAALTAKPSKISGLEEAGFAAIRELITNELPSFLQSFKIAAQIGLWFSGGVQRHPAKAFWKY